MRRNVESLIQKYKIGIINKNKSVHVNNRIVRIKIKSKLVHRIKNITYHIVKT